MSIDAIALLRLSFDELGKVLRVAEETDEGTVFRAMGRSLEARALDDAVTLNLALRFDTPEATLGAVLRRDLGELVEVHGDERGVFVFPSVAQVEASTYEAALEELGEGGMWIAIPAAEDARVGPSDALGVFQGLAGGLGPDLFGQVEKMMGQLQAEGFDEDDEGPGEGGPQLPAGLAELAKGFLENDEMRGMIEGMAAQMFGGGDGPPADLAARAKEVAEKATAANPELAEQAEALARAQAAANPELVAKLAGQLGLGVAKDDEEEDEDDADEG